MFSDTLSQTQIGFGGVVVRKSRSKGGTRLPFLDRKLRIYTVFDPVGIEVWEEQRVGVWRACAQVDEQVFVSVNKKEELGVQELMSRLQPPRVRTDVLILRCVFRWGMKAEAVRQAALPWETLGEPDIVDVTEPGWLTRALQGLHVDLTQQGA